MVSRFFFEPRNTCKVCSEECDRRLLCLKVYWDGFDEDRILLLNEAIKRIYK